LSKHCPHCWFCPISFRRNQMFFNSIRKGASRFRSYLRSDEQPYITFQMHAATESTRQRDRTLFSSRDFEAPGLCEFRPDPLWINLHITRPRKRNSYFLNGDVETLPPMFSGVTILSLMPISVS
jgi:hypothetical protein